MLAGSRPRQAWGQGARFGYIRPMAGDTRTPALAPGAVVGGRYRVGRVLGRGGMGEVYAAEHLVTRREVALKIMLAQGAADADATRRFLREARAATSVQHRNVIQVLDVFADDDGRAVMVMELLRGESLADYFARRGPLPLGELASIMAPVVAAVHAAHARGVVHRDLKPDNVFLAIDGDGTTVPKVLDFGIAKFVDKESLVASAAGSQTRTGALLGTPLYMSFEQAMSEKTIDHRTDVWSLGVILFELLTGRRPIDFDNLGEMYRVFLTGSIPKVADACPTLPPDLAALIDACLVKHRDERLADLAPLARALERHAGGDAARPQPSSYDPAFASADTHAEIEATQAAIAATQAAPAPTRNRRVAVTRGVAALVGVAATGLVLTLAVRGPRSEGTQPAASASGLVASASPPIPAAAAPAPLAASTEPPQVDPPDAGTDARTPHPTPPARALARTDARPTSSPSPTRVDPAPAAPAPAPAPAATPRGLIQASPY